MGSNLCFILVLLLGYSLALNEHCDKEDCDSSDTADDVKPFGAHRPSDFSIPTLKYSPSGSDFYHRYVHGRQPVVIRGAANHWPAKEKWKNETYLRQKSGTEAFTVDTRKKFDGKVSVRKPLTISEFLDIYKTEPVYLDSPFPPSKLLHDLYLPPILNCEELSSTISQMTLLFSNGNTTSAFHHDGYDNVIVLLSGTKHFILIDSKYSDDVYADDAKLFPGVLPFDPEKIDFKAFPKLAKVPFYEITLYEGDMIYIPQYWWHIVRSYGSPNIAVNSWFGMFEFDSEYQDAGLQEDVDIAKVSLLYDTLVKKQPDTIKCSISNKPLNSILKINTSDPALGHLRIPRKNEQPADVLLASGYTMPVMGFGTATLGEDTLSVVKTALETGYRLIDTAQGYPLSEPQVAKAIADSGIPRKDIFIITKLHPRYLGYEPTLKSVEMSLRALSTDYIDLFLIHSKTCDDFLLTCAEGEPRGTWKESWKAMEELHRQGKIRSLGVSNFNVDELQELVNFATVPVSAVQNWFDPFHQDRKARRFCNKHGIRYIGYSTLGTQWVYFHGLKTNPVLQSKVFSEISSHYEYVISQVVLRWAIHQNVTVIPRSRNSRNIYLNFRSLDLSLNENEIEMITNVTDYEFHPLERLDRGEGECVNLEADCPQKAEAGQCKEQADLMLRNCKKSCKLCVVEDPRSYEPLLYIGSEDGNLYAIGVLYGDQRWKFTTDGKILSSPALSTDGETAVIFGSNDGRIYALSPSSGKLLWNFQTGGGVVAGPVITANGIVYVGSHDHQLYALDAVSGALHWKTSLTGPIYARVAVDETQGTLFVGCAADDSARILTLSSKDGSVLWKFADAGKIFANPVLSADKKTVYFCSLDRHVYALESKSGNLLWSLDTQSEIESAPVISKSDGTLFVGLVSGNLLAVNTLPGPLMGTVKWTLKAGDEAVFSPALSEDSRLFVGVGDRRILAVNETTGDILWSSSFMKDYVSSPLGVGRDNVVYAASRDSHVYALNGEDGLVIWKYATNGTLSLSAPALPQHYRMDIG